MTAWDRDRSGWVHCDSSCKLILVCAQTIQDGPAPINGCVVGRTFSLNRVNCSETKCIIGVVVLLIIPLVSYFVFSS